jgi:hypothetical protein
MRIGTRMVWGDQIRMKIAARLGTLSAWRIPGRWRRTAMIGAAVVVAGAGTLIAVSTAEAATITGTMVLNNVSRPGGGVWLPGAGGHFWVSDNVLGICEAVPTAGPPPFQTSRCNGTAKGGQALFDPTTNLVYVADTSSKTNQIMRFVYSPANDTLGGTVNVQVPNVTSVGGGAGGGRAQSLALVTGADGTQRLYVGYIKSGDIMQVLNPSGKDRTGAAVAPSVSKVADTSDGKGDAALAIFTWTDAAGARHDDLYIAETGGFGLSVIRDVDGTGGRPACGSTATPCKATTITTPNGGPLFSFPSGLVTDGTLLYVADSPLNTPAQVLRWNPVTNAKDVYSTNITPSYVSQDNVTRTQYQNITGLALNQATLDLYVADDPTFPLATPINAQGHVWKIAGNATQPTVTGIAPSSGSVAGGVVVTVTGTNLVNAVAGSADAVAFGTTIKFGTIAATKVTCTADGTSCTATSPAVSGAGVVDIRVTNVEGQTSAAVAADQFTYTAAPVTPGAPTVTAVSPQTGLAVGGTTVTITGTGLANPDGTARVSFGTIAATGVTCTADATKCTVTSPAGPSGQTVDIQVTTTIGTSAATAADRFTWVTPRGTVYSYGITAPKGGVTFIPNGRINADGTPAGHYWISDHGNGLCRLDPVSGAALFAPNVAVCDPGFSIGSPGQAVYEPNANPDGTHYIFVPDNAVRSPGVWRLTFDPATETISNPVGMAPGLMNNLKTNALALSADGHDLYVGDLVDGNIRRINGIDGDPRSQTAEVIATTQAAKVGGPSKGINGTMALLGNRLFLPENNAATYVDLTAPCAAKGTAAPCSSVKVNFISSTATVFVAGVAVDARHNVVYISESPGTANATIYRFDNATISAAVPNGTPGVVYVTEGGVPAAGTPEATVWCSITCTRPADPALTPGGSTGFPFAEGLFVDPTTSKLYLTEDVTAGARSGRGHVWEVPYIP